MRRQVYKRERERERWGRQMGRGDRERITRQKERVCESEKASI